MPFKSDIHNEGIKSGLKYGQSVLDISRKIYLGYPTAVFIDNEDTEFEIRNAVANHFKISFTSVQIAGSAKTGYSYHQQQDFVPGESDLDLAIIDQSLFFYFTQEVYKFTKGYSDLSKFPRKEGKSTFPRYKECLAFGFFRPDLMPTFPLKNEWFDFFRKLSVGYVKMFKNINSAIYATTFYFEAKQSSNIELYQSEIGGHK